MKTREEVIDQTKIELAHDLFYHFCLYYDPLFFLSRPYLKVVAWAFQWLFDHYLAGLAKSITVSLPPRAGKSYITSLFCAWWMGRLPELAIMRNSNTARLYRKLSYDTRKIVKDIKYRVVFPDVYLSEDKKAVDGWNLQTSKQVGYFGAGCGGSIIGFGCNLAVYDDLYAGIEDAMNDNSNESVIRWKGGDHNSRKELNCPEIGIGTRWRMNDVIGDEIKKGNVDKEFKVSALIMDDPKDPDFKTKYPNGKSFCENVNTTEFYLKEKRDLDEAIFNAEYMQEPMEIKGLAFPLSQLNFYNPATVDVDKMSLLRYGVIDPANEGGDDLSSPAGYLIQDKIYLHDVIYNTDGTDVNEDACYLFIQKNKLNGVRFEGNSAWYLFGQGIRRKLQAAASNCTFRIITNTENKHTRILAQCQFIKNHVIFRSDWESIPEYRKFMKNLTSYMKDGTSTHEDSADSLAELAKYFREMHKTLW